MADYPNTLPVKDAAGALLSTNPHSVLHDDMYDEIVAIATELGTLPKGTAASVKARLDSMPRGVVGYAEVTSAQNAIDSVADITSLTVTWTAVSARRYRISFFCPVDFNWVSGNIQPYISITDGSNTQKQIVYLQRAAASFNGVGVSGSVTETGLSGSTTRKLRAAANADNGTVDIAASATSPAYILVEDIGPA